MSGTIRKTFHFERLDNGLLRTYDYQCQWALTYKQVDGEWQPSNMVAMGTPYRGIVAKLNERKELNNAQEIRIEIT